MDDTQTSTLESGVPTIQQAGDIQRDANGHPLPGQVLNPEGKGGFKDHPELINEGGRPKNQESFTYWMNHFKNMPMGQFLLWEKQTPMSDRSVAATLAYARVFKARETLEEFKEVADRTEGKAPQTIKHEGGFFSEHRLEIVTVSGEEDHASTAQQETNADVQTP